MTQQDPTRIGSQEALQGGRRRRWLVPGTAFALIVIGMFIFALQLQAVVPVIGIAWAAVLLAGMFVAAATIRDPRRRNRTFAWLMGAMAAGSLLCAIALMLIEWL